MELFFVLLLVPLAWLFIMPGGVKKRAGAFRFAGIGAIILAVAAGWIGVQVTTRPTNAPVDYAASDDSMRALLSEPETAPRYSFNN